MNKSIIALAMLSISAPALSQAPTENIIESSPKTALQLLEQMARSNPRDASTLRLLGNAYAAEQRFDDAANTLDRAQAIAPLDNDIALARARVALWSGNKRKAITIVEEIARREPNNSELAAVNEAIQRHESDVRGPNVNLTHSISRVKFNNGLDTWTETTLAGDIAIERQTRLNLEITREARQIASDTRFGVRVDRRINEGSIYIAATVTPNDDFREKWSISAGGEKILTAQIAATLDARRASYGTTSSTTITPGVRLATANQKFTLAMRSIHLWTNGAHKNGWATRFDAYPNEGLGLFAGAATYPETEAGVTRQVKAIYAGTAVSISNQLTLRLTADHQSRAQTYRRTGLAIGLGWRF